MSCIHCIGTRTLFDFGSANSYIGNTTDWATVGLGGHGCTPRDNHCTRRGLGMNLGRKNGLNLQRIVLTDTTLWHIIHVHVQWNSSNQISWNFKVYMYNLMMNSRTFATLDIVLSNPQQVGQFTNRATPNPSSFPSFTRMSPPTCTVPSTGYKGS